MSGRPKYRYELAGWERDELEAVISAKVCSKERRLRAYILLKCDSGNGGFDWLDEKIVDAYSVSLSKIYNVRKRMVEDGLERALGRKKRLTPPTPRKLDGEQEAHLIAICCSEAPEGRTTWTMELLADEMVCLKIVEEVSRETIRRTLKKMNLSLG